MGIIDTISASFRLIARKPWLAIIPLFLDLFLWLGPRLSMQPLAEKTWRLLEEWASGFSQGGTNPETGMQTLETAIELLQSASVAEINLFELLVWGSLGMPSVSGPHLSPPTNVRILHISEWWQLIPLELVLLGGGLLLSAAFLSMLGYQVRGEPMRLSSAVEWVMTTWVRLLMVIIPVALMFLSALFIGMLFGPLLIVALLGILWLLLYISFFPQAIAMAGHKPFGAVLSSFHVVRLNLWPTVGLLVLVAVLSNGLGLIWQNLVQRSATSALVAIVASSYVGTALTTALFLFYRDRLILLHEIVRRQRSA